MRQRWRSNVNSALYGSLCRRSAIVWGKDHKMQGVPSLVTTVWFSLYLSVVVAFFVVFVFVSLFSCFWFLTFVESKYYSLNSAALNSGLSFKSIKRERNRTKCVLRLKNVDFYCWLRKWELCYLESMERQIVAFATEDGSSVNLFLCER